MNTQDKIKQAEERIKELLLIEHWKKQLEEKK